MAENKTQQTAASVSAFLDRVPDARRREEARKVSALMRRLTGAEPRMWGGSIVGFGNYAYQYSSGHSGDWPLVGFSPRAKELVLYIMSGFDQQDALLKALGPCKTGKSCLYVRSLEDVDLDVLARLIESSIARMAQRYGLTLPASVQKAAAKAKPAAKSAPKPKAKSAAPAPGAAASKAKTGAQAQPKPKAATKAAAKPARATPRAPKPKPAPAAKAKAGAKSAASARKPAARR